MLLAIFMCSILVELAIYFTAAGWKQRTQLAGLSLSLGTFSAIGMLIASFSVFSALLVFVQLYRTVNNLRLAKGRMHEAYLRRVCKKSSMILIASQLAILGFGFAAQFADIDLRSLTVIISLGSLQLAAALSLLVTICRGILKTRFRHQDKFYADKELPTVTVAIPARNETEEMAACLDSMVSNDYPKLEILVLDDCSHDRTPEIIRSYAHKGVRFIRGSEPDKNWLAKNQAYDRLADEASGELILFCGVDVRLGPHTINALVSTMLSRKKSMISVMPLRRQRGTKYALIQPMRYWWELALPRRSFNRPPVLSSCWLIKRKMYQKLGGMDAVSRSIIPEAYFARELVKQDGYSFMRSTAELEVITIKEPKRQLDTAVRMRYPQIRRRPELAMALTLGHTAFLIGPFILSLIGFFADIGAAHYLALAAAAVLVVAHLSIVSVSNPPNWWVALINFPFASLTELAIGNYSMWKYEFSDVVWRGRSICMPVMHAIPKLPKV